MSARILIVEDTPNNLQLMRYLLEAGTHTVLAAENAEDALEIARSGKPDLVVMDVQLPGMNGDEAIMLIRSDPELKALTVVAVTAFAMVGTKEQMLDVGFDGYLTKPIEPRTFLSDIEQFLKESLRGPGLPGMTAVASFGVEDGKEVASDGPVVLAVDDRPTNITLLRRMLEPYGYRINSASSIDAAIALAEREKPDAVLSDVHIGNQSGIDLLAHVRNTAELADTPFVFLTATVEHVEVITDEWDVSVIRRPIEPARLLKEVRGLIESKVKRK